jgi:hypothetical protein
MILRPIAPTLYLACIPRTQLLADDPTARVEPLKEEPAAPFATEVRVGRRDEPTIGHHPMADYLQKSCIYVPPPHKKVFLFLGSNFSDIAFCIKIM